MVVALCTAVMSKSRVCPRLPNSVCKIEFSVANAAGWVLAIPVLGSEIRAGGERRGRKMSCYSFCSLDRRGWGNNCWFWDKSSRNFSSVFTYCPIHPFFASAVAPAWGFWTLTGQRRLRDSLLIWQPALIHFSVRLLSFKDWSGFWLIYQMDIQALDLTVHYIIMYCRTCICLYTCTHMCIQVCIPTACWQQPCEQTRMLCATETWSQVGSVSPAAWSFSHFCRAGGW